MKDKVKVIISDDQNVEKLPRGTRMLIRRCCNAVLVNEGFQGPAEISVTIVDDATIHRYNKQYRNIDRSTDVLSFPLGVDGKYDINNDTGATQTYDRYHEKVTIVSYNDADEEVDYAIKTIKEEVYRQRMNRK